MRAIRNSAKAVIIRDGRLLAIELRDEQGPWFALPGGGQLPGETLHQALIRECREEVNALVRIGPLRFVREYISAHHEFAHEDAEAHQVDFMFACDLLNPEDVGPGTAPDVGQCGVRWLPLRDLNGHRLYPLKLRAHLMDRDDGGSSVYLGDIN
ncbi:MAG: NUDIX domain-containing protein [Candidatus Edwardsbacteria bacterium]|jgi:8-oxo-dGTP pyrophosphatase MutT (NUDIX family)|nr:NUDIX domain-containing protein [Candidatus Edwardsbacteria bacterium]